MTLVIVILSWAFLQALGFALIYWSAYPGEFRIQGDHPAGLQGFSLIFYFSLEILTTLGLGDVLPVANWLRFLCTFEALVGLALVTASVSSILLIFPALARLRNLASRTQTLLMAQHKTGVDAISADGERLLSELALDVIRARIDFIHFPVVYYFHAERRRSSLPHSLPDLLRLAELGSRPDASQPVRLAASTLQTALHDLGQVLSVRFIHGDRDDTARIFRVYAEDHVLGKNADEI